MGKRLGLPKSSAHNETSMTFTAPFAKAVVCQMTWREHDVPKISDYCW